MTPADWNRVKEAFQSALELNAEELKDYLKNLQTSDPGLFEELDTLLRHHHATRSLFADGPPIFDLLDEDEFKHWIGRNIGPYQVIAKLGQGGMGAVFQAIRIDDHYLKNVAIKIVRGAYTTGPYLRRFKSERQILASLDHPNIGHLLDGGTTEEGLPYLVMEYVAGKPIDQYCDKHSLSISDRLELFLGVCSAVEYAHQKLVIHRDLKPANILVTEEGVPKLLDFGIAKLLDPELYFQTEEEGTAARAMTPEYASPEQVRGDAINTASDVYALGIILYRLLTGHPPYALSKSNPVDWAHTIQEVAPERPSVVIDRPAEIFDSYGGVRNLTPEDIARLRGARPAALRRSLRDDIDNILLMALRKDPARRYGSVEQFANDIRRSLKGLPVQARRDTIAYRAGKFVRRHRIPVAAAALVLLSLTAGIVVSARQARIANQQRALAEQRFNEIRSVSHDLIFEIHDSIQYLPGATSARQLVVQAALRYLNTLSKDAPGNVSLQEEIATAYEKVGDVQGGTGRANLGDTSGALDSYARALAIRKSILATSPSNPSAREGLSNSYLRVGTILEDMGRYQDALQYHQGHLELSKQLAAEAPRDPKAQSRLANSYDGMGGVLTSLARWDEAVANFEASSTIYKALADAQFKASINRRNWALERKKIGGVLEQRGQVARAMQEYQSALAVDEELAGSNPKDASTQRDVAIDYSNLGDAISKQGDQDAAIRNYRHALAIDNQLAAADLRDASAQSYLVYDSYRLGDALLKAFRVRSAIAVYRLAAARAEKNAGSDPGNVFLRSELARVYSKLAKAHYTVAMDASLAKEAKRQSLATARATYGKSLAIWIDLREHGALQGPDAGEPDRVAEELKNCTKEIERPS
jgi:non-specific serine/threonine protein kinase/serine/threonine-protein kinase